MEDYNVVLAHPRPYDNFQGGFSCHKATRWLKFFHLLLSITPFYGCNFSVREDDMRVSS